VPAIFIMTPLTQIYTQADLARWFSRYELQKARPYAQEISDLHIGDDQLSASVQGTQPMPYRVEISLFDIKGRITLEARCSCPVGHNCKHCAAVLVAAMVQRDRPVQPTSVNPVVLGWADELLRLSRQPEKTRARPSPKTTTALHYVVFTGLHQTPRLALVKGRTEANGPKLGEIWNGIDRALLQAPQFVRDEDLEILRLLRRLAGKNDYWNDLPLDGAIAAQALRLILETQRCWYAQPLEGRHGSYLTPRHAHFTPLEPGEPRPVRLQWRRDGHGDLNAQVGVEPAAGLVLPTLPLWYVDAASGDAGEIDCRGRDALLLALLKLPPLTGVDLPVVASALAEAAPDLPSPLQAESVALRVIDAPPKPRIRLDTLTAWAIHTHRGYDAHEHGGPYDFAVVEFCYEDQLVPLGEQTFFTRADGTVVEVKRHLDEEKCWLDSLASYGFAAVESDKVSTHQVLPVRYYGLENERAWTRFFPGMAAGLQSEGWHVAFPAEFRHHFLEAESWEADLEDTATGWLSLSLGIVVAGQRVPLAPLLYDLFQHDERWLDVVALSEVADDEHIVLTLPDGQRVGVPAGRIKPLAATLIDLFDTRPGEALKLSRLDAPRLDALSDMARWQFRGFETVQTLARRLRNSDGVRAVLPPEGFGLSLRPYQQEGLAWLQFLREQALGGILADDMGLGKTAQTLAHLVMEKAAGRLDRPALVVLPTSLIFNWKRESANCAPGLKVLALHGKERKPLFEKIPEHDICLTTYPLLWRDEEELARHRYSWLILDEAQTVKNARSRAAGVVRRLDVAHRLCLTGTPLENHLGELWAQFDFLLPGFLGDSKHFTKTWRTPIEKYGDTLRRDLLAARVKPFILRRKKEEVARDLPEKTIIVRTVELEGGQRDLYETVRSAMDARVREAIADKGFNRSQIVILDALLKLRQVCCDPRLLKVAAVSRVKERAKLDLLMDMLPELVDEGRRVLVFSQFTSMLALIEDELTRAGIDYVLLSGETRDREAVVERFQSGQVPVFLISLKAGGVGLNLTAADTVIHFDPWWNPAAENQATDRAHRIGQKQAVFVYKLVVSGSIEEKILTLQEKKAELAAGVLSEDAAVLGKFGENDIQALLAPLPPI